MASGMASGKTGYLILDLYLMKYKKRTQGFYIPERVIILTFGFCDLNHLNGVLRRSGYKALLYQNRFDKGRDVLIMRQKTNR